MQTASGVSYGLALRRKLRKDSCHPRCPIRLKFSGARTIYGCIQQCRGTHRLSSLEWQSDWVLEVVTGLIYSCGPQVKEAQPIGTFKFQNAVWFFWEKVLHALLQAIFIRLCFFTKLLRMPEEVHQQNCNANEASETNFDYMMSFRKWHTSHSTTMNRAN